MKMRFYILSLLVSGAVFSSYGATNTWDGGGTDNYWSTAENWVGDTVPTNGATLIFDGSSRMANTNDLLTSCGAITFNTGGWNIKGNDLAVSGNITGNGALNTIGLNLKFSKSASLFANGSALQFDGDITGSDSSAVTLYPEGNSWIYFYGQISDGSGGTLSIKGVTDRSNYIIYGTNNTFTGSVSIGANCILKVTKLANGGQPSSIGAGTSYIRYEYRPGYQSTYLEYIGDTDSSTDRRIDARSYYNANIKLIGNNSPNNSALAFTSTAAYDWTVAYDSVNTLKLYGSSTAENLFALQLKDYSANRKLRLEISTSGTWIITGNNTYSAGTTITFGALQVGDGGTTGAVGSGPVVANGTLIANRSDELEIPGALSGHGTLINRGSGTLILSSSANNFTGNTTIESGAFGGHGLLASNLTFAAGSAFVPLISAAGTGSSARVTGTVNLNNAEMQANISYAVAPSDKIFILINDGSAAVNGIFKDAPQGAIVSFNESNMPLTANISYTGDAVTQSISGGNDIVLYNVKPDLDAFRGEMKITFSGYTGANITDFPVVIKVSNGNPVWFKYSDFASPYGGDLRFTDADGVTALDYEIEKWDTSGESVIWVKVPLLEGTGSDSIQAYWGNPDLISYDADTFDPATDISGCSLWLDASDNIQTNASGGVTNWVDKSGNGNNMTVSTNTAPTLTVNSVNGRPAVRFYGTNALMCESITNFPTSEWDIFIVQKTITVQDSFTFSIPGATPGRVSCHIPWSNGDVYWDCGGTGGDARLQVSQLTTTQYSIWNLVSDDGIPNKQEIRQNGHLKKYDNSALTISADGHAFYLGQGDGRYLDGEIAEFLVFRRDLSAVERNKIGLYLAKKYGIETGYGDPDAPEYTRDGSVWSKFFKGVWHLAADGGHDSTANGNYGTTLGNTPTSGLLDGAQHFGGDGDYIALGTGPSLSGAPYFTASAWVKTSVGGNQLIIQQRGAGAVDGEWLALLNADGKPYFWTYNGSMGFTVTATNAVNDGSWHYVTYRSNGDGSADIFVDGELNNSDSNSVKNLNSSIPLCIGREQRDGGQKFNGDIDEVRLATYPRTAVWIKACYLNQRPGSDFMEYSNTGGFFFLLH